MYIPVPTFGNYCDPFIVMVQCFNAEDRRAYIHRLEKVKFGVPIDDAFTHDIPATLLVLLLKINKQGPVKKDIWRAPGNQSHVRKLINIMQHGRLVNIDNFSVYTAASVVKKFLCKIPYGIFGPENEQKLFEILALDDVDKQGNLFCRIVSTLPIVAQHLLVLLVGTFSCIVEHAETYQTRMNPEALGVSVAPSIFHTCIHDRGRAKMEDLVRFRDASKVVSFMIKNFGRTNLFPRENYEFYARITSRTLRVDENWQFSFQFPLLGNSTSRNGRTNGVASGGGAYGKADDSAVASGSSADKSKLSSGGLNFSRINGKNKLLHTNAAMYRTYDLCFTTSSFPRYHQHNKGGYVCALIRKQRDEINVLSSNDPNFSAFSSSIRRRTLSPPRSTSSPAQVVADSLDDLWRLNKALLPLVLSDQQKSVGGRQCDFFPPTSGCPYLDNDVQEQQCYWASLDDFDVGIKANSCEF